MRVVLFLCLVLAALGTPIAATADGDSAPVGGFIAIMAEDARGLATWYEENLGFRIVQEGQRDDGKSRFVLLALGSSQIEILQNPGATKPPIDDEGVRAAWRQQGFFKAGFVVPDLDGLETKLRGKRTAFSHGIVQPPGNPYRTFAVRDPEGNVIQFFGK